MPQQLKLAISDILFSCVFPPTTIPRRRGILYGMIQHSGSPASQTHFIGVSVPDHLSSILSDCRSWMGEKFGCRSGFMTPFHVTLVPPFALSDPELIGNLAAAIASCAREQSAFSARARGFGTFAERTLFARVEPDERWGLLREALYARLAAALPDLLRKDTRPFVPHLTVANRDIPAFAVAPALRYLEEIALDETFPADNITLFERRHGVWEPALTETLRAAPRG